MEEREGEGSGGERRGAEGSGAEGSGGERRGAEGRVLGGVLGRVDVLVATE